jgi:hypothetical protein
VVQDFRTHLSYRRSLLMGVEGAFINNCVAL